MVARHGDPLPRDANGVVRVEDIKMNDLIERDDVIYVRESLF